MAALPNAWLEVPKANSQMPLATAAASCSKRPKQELRSAKPTDRRIAKLLPQLMRAMSSKDGHFRGASIPLAWPSQQH